jgi:hypothetical protein
MCECGIIDALGVVKCAWVLCGLPTFPLLSAIVALIGSVHKSVAGYLNPRKINCLLYITSHFNLVNSTEHPALHSTRMPINDAIVNSGTMCPVKILGRPVIVMPHTCVVFTVLPLGKLIVNGCNKGRKLLTGVPSMINMEVAPLSAIAWFALITIVLRYCWLGEPNICCPVAAKDGRGETRHILSELRLVELEQLDVGTVTSSSLITLLLFVTTLIICVGSKGIPRSKLFRLVF